ncbi:P-loop containing nucleoside triphosphate hydrolase [Arabidopsis thaliana x Arabidopsis arenosa]|uniref:P-loop containing nucleoside triphosphate hydrolase n=1 Tax=Arabidopsis thaliana x Arabidopsis arenosa TaxID=1240361 RepID=A0A8T1YWZ5_9BRAS|nr:P-loop containing nucleoside triphosphate hydrolase [Arabidopsis thaliana x Arabidopsis arenosa]
MFFSKDLPSPTSVFTAYASMAGYMMMIRSMAHELIPAPIQDFIYRTLRSLFFRTSSSTLTLTIDDDNMGMNNEIYRAAQTYLSTKISPDAVRLRISKGHKDKHVNLYLSDGEIVNDVYEDVQLVWRFVTDGGDKKSGGGGVGGRGGGGRRGGMDDDGRSEYFELSFDKKHKDLILSSYVPYIESKAKEIRDERRILMLHSLNSLRWESVILEHPSTFETMAMEDDLKRDVIEDLDRFIRRKEFYKRVGKAWKRGYLLYGPPGTGKSSLVAAMANYLKFDVYDLQLASVMRDSDLRRLLLATRNRSILVIEDIDCAVDLPNRVEQPVEGKHRGESQGPLTLSGLLNFIDGLWSSCGDERIIIFTTNHKDRLDPALLRPGRMDMHIYMGHCSFQGFKTLASNYLGLSDSTMPHRLYPEIERLIDGEVMTPAQVAEELMKSEDADVALEGLVNVLEKMRLKSEESNPVMMKKKESRLELEEMTLRRDTEGSPRKNSKRFKKLVLFWT